MKEKNLNEPGLEIRNIFHAYPTEHFSINNRGAKINVNFIFIGQKMPTIAA